MLKKINPHLLYRFLRRIIRRKVKWCLKYLNPFTRYRLIRRKVRTTIKNLEERHLVFNTKHFLLIASSVFIFIWLKNPITDLFDKYLVDVLFTRIPSKPLGIWLGLAYLLLISVICVNLHKRYNPKSYRPTFLLIAALLFACTLYLIERISGNHYFFWSIFDSKSLKIFPAILDPIFIIAFLFASYYLLFEFRSNYLSDEISFINPDLALISKEDDEYERKSFVEKFAKSIMRLRINSHQSFVIGINGRWGFGKSSLLQMLANEFHNEIIKIEFNPWISNRDYNLIKDFFNTMEDNLSKHIATSNLFKKYGENLTKIDNDKNPLKSFGEFFKDKPLKKRFEELALLIKKTHKQVYVFIDDIDRLNKEEVFETLRLVRSSACFPNMVFIIAYDRTYIEKALKYNKIPDANRYLEKIIQLEIKLPVISQVAIRNAFVKQLNNQIDKINLSTQAGLDAKRMAEGMVIGNSLAPQNAKYAISSIITKIFLNKRDIIRFSNSFILRLSLYYDQIYLPDLFILELIRFYAPELFEKISHIEDNYSIEYKPGTTLRILSLLRNDQENIFQIDPTLLNYINTTYVNDPRRQLIDQLIRALISEPLTSDPNQAHGIYYEEYYESYFTLVIPANVVSTTFIQNLITQ